ncbi:porin [uncultured Tolumonas sp.]|uniref:porin n=1 Tax=uncultured Tolumonas sp. TaxID=263765 RepID=UPI00292F636E|nr:porin [uncultured Tolumonas sp.]
MKTRKDQFSFKLCCLTILSILTTSATNAAIVYDKDGNTVDVSGKLIAKGKYAFSGDNSHKDAGFAGVNVNGQTKIDDDLTGYGFWEYRAYQNTAAYGQATETRQAFAGVKSKSVGSIDYGRSNGILYDAESFTDVAPSHSAMTWGGNYNDNFMTSRANSVLTYRSPKSAGPAKGLNYGVQYQSKNEYGDVKTSNGTGIGISLGYDIGNGISLIGAYSDSNRTHDQKADGLGDKAQAWASGIKYDNTKIYLATVYAQTQNTTRTGSSGSAGFAKQTENFEAIAQYKFDSGFRPSLGYVQTRGKDLAASGTFTGGDADLAKFAEVGVAYFFNPKFKVYADYYFNLLDKDSTYVRSVGGMNGSADVLALNASYYF